jgi:hypothetical protein
MAAPGVFLAFGESPCARKAGVIDCMLIRLTPKPLGGAIGRSIVGSARAARRL